MSGKPLVSSKDAIEVLNRALAADSEAVRLLFSYRVGCNQELSNDPTIQVLSDQPKGTTTLGALGLLNGVFGVRDHDLYGYITAVYNVVCPVHGPDESDAAVGDPCPVEGCSEALGLGELVGFTETE